LERLELAGKSQALVFYGKLCSIRRIFHFSTCNKNLCKMLQQVSDQLGFGLIPNIGKSAGTETGDLNRYCYTNKNSGIFLP